MSGRLKRADVMADEIKRWIIAGDLGPGERLPNEAELVRRFGMSKGTVREALKALEIQGLVRLKTGPGGGAAIVEPDFAHAFQLLQNYFFFQPADTAQLYVVRRLIEPELAAAAAPVLDDDDIAALKGLIHGAECGEGPDDLDFHDHLAQLCPNPYLRFMGRFINETLRRVTTLAAGTEGLAQVEAANHAEHRDIIAALEARDGAAARKAMAEHMDHVRLRARGIGAMLEQKLVLSAEVEKALRLAGMERARKGDVVDKAGKAAQSRSS